MNLRYKIVFSLRILHEYYRDRSCDDFSIIPSEETLSVLRGNGLLFKSAGNKLIVMGRVDDTGKLISDMTVSLKLSFYLQLKNSSFFNFTNLQHLSGGKKYYFSNGNQTQVGTELYLNSKIGVYQSSNDYLVGDMAANGSDTVFEALKPSNSGSVRPLTDKDYWMSRGKVQYAHAEDQVQISPYFSLVKAEGDTNFVVKVYGLNTSTGSYDVQVLETINLVFAVPQTEVPLRLEKLPKGKYKIEVNGNSSYIYVDDHALYKNVFGIVEIFNFLPASNPFALTDEDGGPKAPVFTINFANRTVFWRYVARSSDITSVNDSRPLPDKLTFNPLPGNAFISVRPVPVSEISLTTLSAESAALGNISPIANPGTGRLGTIDIDGNAYYSAEIHLNY